MNVTQTTGTINVDVDDIYFEQYSNFYELEAGTGLTKNINTLNVGAGLGIQVNADDIQAKLSGTTLQVDSDGLSVKGLLTQFEIEGVPTSASVTAASLGWLTNGGNADSLHIHSASVATEVPEVAEYWTVSGTLAKADGV